MAALLALCRNQVPLGVHPAQQGRAEVVALLAPIDAEAQGGAALAQLVEVDAEWGED